MTASEGTEPGRRSPLGPVTRPWRRVERKMTGRFTAETRAPILQVLKAAGASIITWFVCLLIFPGQLPIFGAIAAILCVQESVDQSLSRGIERVVGVILGVSVAIGAGALFGPQSWLFIAALVVAMTLGWLLRMTNSSTNQIAITALLMIALGGLQLGYGIERLVETVIGAAIGVLVNAVIVAPVRIGPVHVAIIDLSLNTAAALRRVADALEVTRDAPWLHDMLQQARLLQDERSEVHALVRRARESLKLNPRGPRYREALAAEDEMFERLQPIVTQVIGMSRALYDLYSPDLAGDAQVIGMADEMRRAAHDLELFLPGRGGTGDETDGTSGADGSRGSNEPDGTSRFTPDVPALTAPFVIVQPHPVHWVLIGSLMEDLRRIRGRITGERDV